MSLLSDEVTKLDRHFQRSDQVDSAMERTQSMPAHSHLYLTRAQPQIDKLRSR
jgi:hypothetical protein